MITEFRGLGRASKSLGLVADWTYALNGKGDLGEVLERLMRLVKADAALITRISTADSKTRYIARCDVQTGKVWPTQPRSFSRTLLGDWLPTAKNGSIWKLSDFADRAQTGMSIHLDRIPEPITEIVACPLEMRNGQADVLELQYRHKPAQHDLDLVIILIGTLAPCWRNRVSGLIVKTLTQKRRFNCVNSLERSDVSVLDTENPAQLTRCEFRICSLLKDGMTVNVIAKTLSIAPTTVRAHLSSVFSKTGTCNQVELLHQLHRQKSSFIDVACTR